MIVRPSIRMILLWAILCLASTNVGDAGAGHLVGERMLFQFTLIQHDRDFHATPMGVDERPRDRMRRERIGLHLNLFCAWSISDTTASVQPPCGEK